MPVELCDVFFWKFVKITCEKTYNATDAKIQGKYYWDIMQTGCLYQPHLTQPLGSVGENICCVTINESTRYKCATRARCTVTLLWVFLLLESIVVKRLFDECWIAGAWLFLIFQLPLFYGSGSILALFELLLRFQTDVYNLGLDKFISVDFCHFSVWRTTTRPGLILLLIKLEA